MREIASTRLSQWQNSKTELHSSQMPKVPGNLDPQADEITMFRRFSKQRLSSERFQELQVAAGTQLGRIATLSPRDPNSSPARELARGFALEVTKYDEIKGERLNLWSENKLREHLINAYATDLYYMELLTQPSILEARLNMLNRGPEGRLSRTIPEFEELQANRDAITWNNIGWGIPERNMQAEIADESTTYVRAQGMWSFICPDPDNPIVAMPIVLPSHPDLVSSIAIADSALVGCLSFVPCDAQFSYPKAGLNAQIECIKTAITLIKSHPLVFTHGNGNHTLSNGETIRQHLVSEAVKRIGVTLKPFPPEKAAERAKAIHEECGVTSFRIFDPRATKAVADAVKAVKSAVPNATIYASQMTGIEVAKSCYEAGANAFILNIGEGGHCSTASGTGMIPNNFLTFYDIQKYSPSNVGIIVDGGVGSKWTLALSLGATGAMKHGSLIGSTIQQTPGLIAIHENGTNKLWKLQSGEAARRTKSRSHGQTDALGMAVNPEGIEGASKFFQGGISSGMIGRLYQDFLMPSAKQIVFCQAQSIDQISRWEHPLFWMPKQGDAAHMAAPHYVS